MNTSARDDDQPGLWPMSESKNKPTTDPRPKSVPPARSQGRTTRQPNSAVAPLNERKLWWIADVADYLGVPVQTIYGWRPKGYGPPPIKVGKHLRWQPATVIAWAKEQERSAG